MEAENIARLKRIVGCIRIALRDDGGHLHPCDILIETKSNELTRLQLDFTPAGICVSRKRHKSTSPSARRETRQYTQDAALSNILIGLRISGLLQIHVQLEESRNQLDTYGRRSLSCNSACQKSFIQSLEGCETGAIVATS